MFLYKQKNLGMQQMKIKCVQCLKDALQELSLNRKQMSSSYIIFIMVYKRIWFWF